MLRVGDVQGAREPVTAGERHNHMRALPALFVTVALVASGCSDDGPGSALLGTTPLAGGSATTPLPGGGTTAGRFVRALTPFADCSAFLEHVKAVARERVGPYGLDGAQTYWALDDVIMEETVPAADMASGSEGGGQDAPSALSDTGGDSADPDGSFTGTNVQELGIDEPDIIKTDGDRILVVSEHRLSFVDISGDEPVLTDQITLPEGWGHELFFAGDRALLFTNSGSWGVPMPVGPIIDTIDGTIDETIDSVGGDDSETESAPPDTIDETTIDDYYRPDSNTPAALVLEVDLSDPSNLSISASMRIEGRYLSARAFGDTVRLAVSSGPDQLPWVYPQSQTGEERATQTNREIIDDSTLEDWIPSYQLTSSNVDDEAPLLACDRMHHPADFSGFEVISVIELDLAVGLENGFDRNDSVGVLAGGQTIYSSSDRFYVATTKWTGADLTLDDAAVRQWSDDYETDLHAFAIAPGTRTEYVASGSVPGSLLNQFSLDEYQGYLRAITTDGSPWDDRNQSETSLVVLQEQGDRLVPVGEVGGIGKGEQLYSARLIDDVGFAVTFRQTDPFYVLDLSDPTDPRIAGELKIPGVSTYLHPIGDHMVLGIGQDATEEGRTTGLKLSLFDVSDPARPREVSVWTMPDSYSPAENDHRAFQTFGSTAIVPVQNWNSPFNGVILFDIGDAITEIGHVSHVADVVAESDCRVLTGDDVPEDSELWWLINDPSVRLQLCDADDRGGWGTSYCETTPTDEIGYWYIDESALDETLTRLGATPDDRFEMCFPNDPYQEQIQRSLVADGTLWTMSLSTLQANDLATLDPITTFGLR
jgi:hypothetical protein